MAEHTEASRGEFEPTTEQVRAAFIQGSDEDGAGGDFDLWLARYTRSVRVAPSLVAASREALIEAMTRGVEETNGDILYLSDQEADWVADALLAGPVRVAEVTAEQALPDRESVWRDGYSTGKRDYAGSITGGLRISTPNPYVGNARKTSGQ